MTDEAPALRPASDPSAGLVSIFRGTPSEAMALKAALDSLGFQVFVLDQFTKTIDPFITGGNVFEIDLQVPAAQARAAGEAIKGFRPGAARRGSTPVKAANLTPFGAKLVAIFLVILIVLLIAVLLGWALGTFS